MGLKIMVSKWIVVIVVITLPVSITHLVPYLVRFVTYKINQNISMKIFQAKFNTFVIVLYQRINVSMNTTK